MSFIDTDSIGTDDGLRIRMTLEEHIKARGFEISERNREEKESRQRRLTEHLYRSHIRTNVEYLFVEDEHGEEYSVQNRVMTTEVKNEGRSLIEARKRKLEPHIQRIVEVVQQTIDGLLSDPKNSARDISKLLGHRLIEAHREDASQLGVELTRFGKKLVGKGHQIFRTIAG